MRVLSSTVSLVLCLSVLGCASGVQMERRSNLVGFLYPDSASSVRLPPLRASLQLPLRLGIAFVPAESRHGEAAVEPAMERELLEIVAKAFRDRPWVSRVEIVPSKYLQPAGGFRNLQQVARLLQLDVIALVSVDQIQYTNPKWYSFAYITIVGAYILPGDRNDTRTLIDAAVFEPDSGALLLRAPGQSHVRGSTTAVARPELLREDSREGFRIAMGDLAAGLDLAVDEFKAEVVSGTRTDVGVQTAEGKPLRGGGAFGGGELLLLSVFGAAIGFRRSRAR